MKDIINIFRQIEATGSRNEKERIVASHKDNELLKKVLLWVYDPYKVYGIGSKSFTKKYQNGVNEFDDILQLFEYLLIHNNGSDREKTLVNAFINAQPEEDREYYKKMILKDIKLGATASVFNKVWKDLIPTFKTMLAEPFERLPKRVAVEYKFDGVRNLAIKENGVTSMFTRNGKAIEGFNDIIEQINNLPVDNIVFDGELISNNSYKETMEKVFKKTGDKVADFMIFDVIRLDEFKVGKSRFTYEERRGSLEGLFNSEYFGHLYTTALRLSPVVTYLEDPTVEQLDELCQKAVELGFEGVMVKDLDAPYVCKRDYAWQKVKIFETDDYEIIRIEEGKGKNKGRMGKVIIDVNGVEVGLGSGWDDGERKDFWENPSDYIGLYCEVRYQEVIKKTGSLRFPTVVSIRYDK